MADENVNDDGSTKEVEDELRISSAEEELKRLLEEYRFSEVSPDEKQEIYRKLMNAYTWEYFTTILNKDGRGWYMEDKVDNPETSASKIEILNWGNMPRVKLQCQDMTYRRGGFGLLAKNLFVVGEKHPYVYVMGGVNLEFDGPSKMDAIAEIADLSHATSFSPEAYKEFWGLYDDEKFREGIVIAESHEQMVAKLSITDEKEFRHCWGRSQDPRNLEVVVAALGILHKQKPEVYPDFQAGMRSLLTGGVEAMKDSFNNQTEISS